MYWHLDFAIQKESNQFAALTSTKNNEKIKLEVNQSLYDAAGNMQKLDEDTNLSWSNTNQLVYNYEGDEVPSSKKTGTLK